MSDFPEDEEFELLDEPSEVVIIPTKKVNYLNNKDMLKEIHRSKISFCEFIDKKYSDYDIIVEDLSEIFDPIVQENAKIARAARLGADLFNAAVSENKTVDRPKIADFRIKPDTISLDDVVFRVLTYEHIPLATGRKKTPKTEADLRVKLNFAPFKHYIIEGGQAKEVGKSHSKNGKFSLDHGSITTKLAKMFILLTNKYAQRYNWRSYTYLEEMKGESLLQLSRMGLQFDELRGDNPFSYYTMSLQNSFTRVHNLEKKNQELRDDLLIDRGATPSFSRQLAIEDEIRQLRDDAYDSAKRGIDE